MPHTRRTFMAAVGAAVTGTILPTLSSEAAQPPKKKHIVTLSFDDGFKKSFIRTAEIYEKHKLSACFNVVAAGLPEDKYIKESPIGDFGRQNQGR